MTHPPLDEHGSERNRLVIRLDEYEGHRYLDIRLWYRDRKKGEWARTKKGVTLNRDRYRVVRRALEKHDEAIKDWIGIDYVPEEVTRYEEAMETATESGRFAAKDLVSEEYEERRDPRFCDVAHEGGKAVVRLNRAHPLAETLSTAPRETRRVVEQLVLAFDRARTLIEGAPAFDSRTLLLHLEEDWGKFLRSALEGEDG